MSIRVCDSVPVCEDSIETKRTLDEKLIEIKEHNDFDEASVKSRPNNPSEFAIDNNKMRIFEERYSEEKNQPDISYEQVIVGHTGNRHTQPLEKKR